MNPYNCSIITSYDQLTKAEVKEFWDKGVCMDDWDVILILPPEILEEFETDDVVYDEDGYSCRRKVKKYRPKDYVFDSFLRGSYKDVWYKIELDGKEVAVGVSYHG